jgi:hypothetical protein
LLFADPAKLGDTEVTELSCGLGFGDVRLESDCDCTAGFSTDVTIKDVSAPTDFN